MDVPLEFCRCVAGPIKPVECDYCSVLSAGVYTRCVLMTSLHLSSFLQPPGTGLQAQELQDALRFVDYYVPRSDSVLSTEAYVLSKHLLKLSRNRSLSLLSVCSCQSCTQKACFPKVLPAQVIIILYTWKTK